MAGADLRKGLRQARLVIWAGVAVLVVVVGIALGMRYLTPAATDDRLVIGGPFTLTDQNGATVVADDIRGKPTAMFFGYTYCPDVCPTTLADLTAWMAEMGPLADRMNVVFVSVDPERDTPDHLRQYLSAFDPRIRGLTGTPEQIAEVVRSYRAYAEKVPQQGGSYLMNHTASVYLIDADGGFFGTISYEEPRETGLAKLRRLVSA